MQASDSVLSILKNKWTKRILYNILQCSIFNVNTGSLLSPSTPVVKRVWNRSLHRVITQSHKIPLKIDINRQNRHQLLRNRIYTNLMCYLFWDIIQDTCWIWFNAFYICSGRWRLVAIAHIRGMQFLICIVGLLFLLKDHH